MNHKDRSGSSSLLKHWLGRIRSCLGSDLLDKDGLAQVLQSAKEGNLMDAEALTMIEGVLQVADLQVRDIMIPRAQTVVIHRDDTLETILPLVIESAHSRFPVIGDDKGEVIGILLAKDLLQFSKDTTRGFNVREVVRSAVFVPESKRLNILLKEFRESRNHMAIVVDEYGLASGLVTIEDVLEQIVGEIEDEYDFDEDAFIMKRADNDYTAKAHTRTEDFNAYFGTNFDDDSFDTIGGMVTKFLGHVPKRGESVVVDDLRFRVIRSDSRKIRLLKIERVSKEQDVD